MKIRGNIDFFYWFNFLLYFRPHWPIAIIYFEGITHSYAQAMLVFSIVFVTQSVLELPTGWLSDFMGRKKTLLVGALISFCSLVFYALGLNFEILALGAVLEGLSRALFHGTKDALVYESLKEQGKEETYDHVLGRVSSMYQLGLGISAIVGSLLSLYSLSLVLWVSVIPQFLCFAICFFFEEPKHIDRNEDHMLTMLKDAWKQFMKSRQLRLISIAEIIEFGFGEAAFYFQAAFFKMVIPEWLIGIVRSFNHFCSAASFWYAGKVIRFFGFRNTLIGGSGILTLTEFFALVFPTALSPFMMAAASLTFGSSVTARSTLMQREFSDKQRATMDSMVSLAGSLLFSGISTSFGVLADHTSPAHALLLGLVSNVFVIGLYLFVFKKDKQK